ncbi:MAG: hypothetical protein HKM95_14755 [Inquilinus sp.]|nr:hypothetical protein [Inquilinus sp.]
MTMRKRRPTTARRGALFALAMSAVVLFCPIGVWGQRTTEQFIPIGQSPGLSGTVTYAGEIAATDPGARTITLSRPADAGTVTVGVARNTRIWLDRSSVGRPTLAGRFADLAPGSVVEIHFRDPDRRQVAEWIKVESDRPD